MEVGFKTFQHEYKLTPLFINMEQVYYHFLKSYRVQDVFEPWLLKIKIYE